MSKLQDVINDAIAKARTMPEMKEPRNIEIGLSHDQHGRVFLFFEQPEQFISLGSPDDARKFAAAIIRRSDRIDRGGN